MIALGVVLVAIGVIVGGFWLYETVAVPAREIPAYQWLWFTATILAFAGGIYTLAFLT